MASIIKSLAKRKYLMVVRSKVYESIIINKKALLKMQGRQTQGSSVYYLRKSQT
jgi:hypothetical protein